MTSREPLPATAGEAAVEYASFGDRFLADLGDGLIGTILALLAWLLVDRALLGRPGGFLGDDAPFGATDVAIVAWSLWNLTYLVGKTGQSLGRKWAGIKVVGRDGEPIGFWRALARNVFAAVISAPPLYLGFLWVLWDPQRQAWHDKVVRTYVVDIP